MLIIYIRIVVFYAFLKFAVHYKKISYGYRTQQYIFQCIHCQFTSVLEPVKVLHCAVLHTHADGSCMGMISSGVHVFVMPLASHVEYAPHAY